LKGSILPSNASNETHAMVSAALFKCSDLIKQETEKNYTKSENKENAKLKYRG
jgi:hypothetical protein